jgi:DNA repair photolyase
MLDPSYGAGNGFDAAFCNVRLYIINMERVSLPLRGRGAADNPANRFEPLHYERGGDDGPECGPAPATQLFRDRTRSIIATNDSPDVGFEASINPYRGCEHGCIYCYARPFHEYLGLSAGLDFETKILVKEDAPELLRRELASPKWQPQVLAVSGVTDAYQPIERELRLTRRCLEVLVDFRNPVIVITKNHLVARDKDLLAELARHDAACVFVSVTTLDGELARRMEPRATQPQGRLDAIAELTAAGVPTGVMVAPIIPGLTDHEVPGILAACRQAGARSAGKTLVRLPHGVSGLFETWLAQHFPDRKDKVLGRIRAMRGGKLNESRFGKRMKGEGPVADIIGKMFEVAREREGLTDRPKLSAAAFRRPNDTPAALFDVTP